MDKTSDLLSEENLRNSDNLTEKYLQEEHEALVSELEHGDRHIKGSSIVNRVDLIASEKEQGLAVCSSLADEFSYHTKRVASCEIDPPQACNDTETMVDQGFSSVDNVEGIVSRKEDSLSVHPPTASKLSSLCDSLESCDIDPEQAKDTSVCFEGFCTSLTKKEAIESLVSAFEEVRLGEEAEMQEGSERVVRLCAAAASHHESNCMDNVSVLVCYEKDEPTFLHDNQESMHIVAETEVMEAEGVTHSDKTCSGVRFHSHDKAQKDKTERCDTILEDDDKDQLRTVINNSKGNTDIVGSKPESLMPMCLQTAPREEEERAQAGASEYLILEERNLVHGKSDIAEEDNASAGDDGGIRGAMIEMVESPPAVRSADIDAECSQDVSQAEEEAESSECQPHGYTIDKDGSSSLDSTAGSGWKPQAVDGGNGTEDEEANSTSGGEDFASSPALQPPVQQRKKININHQFVREIVKIQQDREQYDREQVERQILAQRAANGAQFGRSSDIKEHNASVQYRNQPRTDITKMPMQRGTNDSDGPTKESQQKHVTRGAKKAALLVQTTKSGSSQQGGNASMESNEQGMQSSRQVHEAIGGRKHDKNGGGRGKQLSSMSIYQPPVVRDSLARNVVELDTSHHQSATYAVSTLPESGTSWASKPPAFPFAGSPNECLPKLGSSSSEDGHVHSLLEEAKVEQGVSIKVTFDTERKHRYIEFSEGLLDSNPHEQANLASSLHRKWDHGLSKGPPPRTINPTFQASPSSVGGPPTIHNRQASFDETPPKVNSSYLTQATRNSSSRLQATISRAERNTSWLQESPQRPTSVAQGSHSKDSADRNSWSQGTLAREPSRSQPKPGTQSRNTLERKTHSFEQADKGAFTRGSGGWLQNSPSSIDAHSSMDYQRGQVEAARQTGWYAGDIRMPSTLLQGFSMGGSHKARSVGPPYQGSSNSLPAFGRSKVPSELSSQFRGSFESQPFNVSRSQHDGKGKQKATTSFGGGKYRTELHSRSSVKDSGSPFQVMMRDSPSNRPQVPLSSPASTISGYPQTDFQQTDGLAWNVDDDDRTSSRDYPHDTLKSTLSESLRKASTQGLQVQLSSKETLFTTMPMQEKWGDIVDDSPDAFDYIQSRAEAERDGTLGSLFYGANNHGSAVFVDAASFRGDTSLYKDSKQDKVSPKYGERSLQNQPAGYGTPARKSVFERLGVQGSFKESILGPPPRALDTRGVLKPSPDAVMSNSQTMSIFQGYDPYYGSPQMSQHSSRALHDGGSGSNTTAEERGGVVHPNTQMKQKRSKRELYVPRRGV